MAPPTTSSSHRGVPQAASFTNLKLLYSRPIEKNSFVSAIDFNGRDSLCVVVGDSLQVLDSGSLMLKTKLGIGTSSKVTNFTDVKFCGEDQVVACAPDGFVRLWDLRTGSGDEPALTLVSSNGQGESDDEVKPLLCCDRSPDLKSVCAGSEAVKEDAFVLFWDVRNSKQLLGGYWDSHSKDVSQVRFHPTLKNMLATGGVDGLVNVFDLEESCEDDALLYTLNTECAVNYVGWVGASQQNVERLGVITTEEEFQLWEAEEAEPTIRWNRETLGGGVTGEVAQTVDHFVAAIPVVDHHGASGAVIVTSSNEGAIELWSDQGVHLSSLGQTVGDSEGDSNKKKKAQKGGGPSGHKDLVRALAVGRAVAKGDSDDVVTLWSAGDDGIICRWKTDLVKQTSDASNNEQQRGKLSSDLKKKAQKHRAKPY